MSTRTLFTFRVFAFFCLWLQWLFDLYWQCTYDSLCIEVQYFTIWGQCMTTFTYTVLILAHIWSEKSDPNDPKMMKWWKVSSYLWTMVFMWDIFISMMFWGFLLPTDFQDQFANHPWGETKVFSDHIIPCFFVTCDWFLNGIIIERNQVVQ